MSLNSVEIFGAVVSWCSILRMAAFTSLATFCRCVGAKRSPNGLFAGSSNASKATVRSNSDRTEGSSSPASLKWLWRRGELLRPCYFESTRLSVIAESICD